MFFLSLRESLEFWSEVVWGRVGGTDSPQKMSQAIIAMSVNEVKKYLFSLTYKLVYRFFLRKSISQYEHLNRLFFLNK